MNPPTRNRLTDSVVRPAMVADDGMPCAAICSHAGSEFGAEGGHDALGDRARHDVAVHRAVFGGEVEQPQ